LDRTILAMEEQAVSLPARSALVAVVGTGDDHAQRLAVAGSLRQAGVAVRPDGSTRKLGKQLESAAKAGARWAVIIGQPMSLKDLTTGEQRDSVTLEEAIAAVSE
jgi:histidyl-tRNA synthetase